MIKKHPKKTVLIIATVALCVFLTYGITYIENSLKNLIQDELSKLALKTCECDFTVKEIKVSLLGLNAKLIDPALVIDNKKHIQFKSAKTNISLSKIFNYEVILTELTLSEGKVLNFDAKSVLFKLIDELTTENPNKKSPWKIRVKNIFVTNTYLTQELDSLFLDFKKVSIAIERKEGGLFELRPFIGTFDLYSKSDSKLILPMHSLSSVVTIYPQYISFDKFNWRTGFTRSSGGALKYIKKNENLEGNLGFLLDPRDVGLPDFIKGKFLGSASVRGHWSEPLVDGTLVSDEKAIPKIEVEDYKLIELKAIDSSYKVRWDNGNPVFSLYRLSNGHPNFKLNIENDILISPEKISGKLAMISNDVIANQINLKNLKSSVVIKGSIRSPAINVNGAIASIGYDNILIRNLSFYFFKNNSEKLLNFFKKENVDDPILILNEKNNNQKNYNLNFNFIKFPFQFKSSKAGDLHFVNGTGILKSLYSDQVSGEGDLVVTSNYLSSASTLNVNFKNDKSDFKLNLFNNSQSISALVDINSKEKSAVASIDFDNFSVSEYYSPLKCSNFNGNLLYKFNPAKYLNGDGKLSIKNSFFGCKPYNFKIQDEKTFLINKGKLNIDELKANGKFGNININGSVDLNSGYQLSAQTTLELQTLTSMLPIFDDLRGRGEGSILLTGEIHKPILNGDFSLKEVNFYIEAFKTTASGLEGNFQLNKNKLIINEFSGKINDGSFSAIGSYDLIDSFKTELQFNFDNIQIEPFENAYSEVSGILSLATNELGKPEIGGSLNINRAFWEQYINVNTLINSISQLFLYDKDEKIALIELPKVFLNINLNAKRDVLVLTNFLEIELAAALKIGGELMNPKIYGNISSLAGWLGYKDKRFDITSGILNFNPGDLVPNVDLIAEAILDTATGESILTILQAKGTLINPIIKLTSDNNLREDEILTLLAISQRDNFATKVNTISNVNNTLGLSFFDESKETGFFKKVLHNLTKFDTLAIEPTANIRSGLIVPTFVAEKYLSDKTTLRGESNLSSDTPGSKVFIDYNIDQHLKLRSGIDTETVQNQTSLLTDISYTLFAKKIDFLDISIEGNIEFSKSKLLDKSRISRNSRIEKDGVKNLEVLIQKIYENEGYFDATTEVTCNLEQNYKRVQYCRELFIKINAGSKYIIKEISFIKDFLPKEVNKKSFLKVNDSDFATQKFISVYRKNLIRNLRNDGYIKSRLKATYKIDKFNKAAIMQISLILGNPVSFVFKGNSLFSAEDFLRTINLFERKEPFGNNTINILVQRIEKLYRDSGHLFASINYKLFNLPNVNRQQYIITIEEGRSIKVGEVNFKGITASEYEKIVAIIRKNYKIRYEQIFKPKFAKAEELLTNIIILKQIFDLNGYPYAEIKYSLDIDSTFNRINVIYKINKGKAYNADWLRLANFPDNIELPVKPIAPYSISKANDYIDKLIALLEENAYYNASFNSKLDVGNQLVVYFEAGPRTKINNINVTGNTNISTDLIKSKLSFKEGDLLIKTKISESRKNLLSLGLFSRVVIEADDGVVDSIEENISLEVLERPLESIQFGGGLHSELGFHFFGELVNKDIFKDGRSIIFRADSYYDPTQSDISQGIMSLALKQPGALDGLFDLNHSIRYQKINLTTFEFDLDRYIADTSFFRRVNENFRFNFGLSLLEESLDNVPIDVVLTDQDTGSAELSFLTFGMFYDKRDNPINPESGFQIFLEADLTNPVLLSDASYLSISSGISNIYTLNSKFQFANRLSSSVGKTFDGESTLPISQRFYAGGRTSVRGFRENSLGPLSEEGNVFGGDFLLVNNFEFRYKLAGAVQIHSFFDSGNVFLQDIGIDLNDLRHSVGVGFRYISPIGPIGFDLGRPLDAREGEDSYRLHFSVGSRF